MYTRGLSWRKRYGGFFAGVSEGQKGVRCGKGADCLAAQDTEYEVEVEAADCYYSSGSDTENSQQQQQQQQQQQMSPPGTMAMPHRSHDANEINNLSRTSSGTARSWKDGGFMAHEVEGIGGAVMMKKRRLVKIGAEIDEEDGADSESSSSLAHRSVPGMPAASAMYLAREIKGERRSFCAWCQRIVPALDDGWET